MKIVCEACQAKYSIADEKVRGKVFKIRCKKCSHVIVVRGSGETGGASAEFASSPSSAPDLALDAGWHIVVDGEQVGPLSEGDIRARLARGEIGPDTYIWKEGLPDWVKISTMSEWRSESETGSPFTASEEGGPFAGAATQVSPGPGADVFAPSHAPSAGAGASDLFASPVHASGGERASAGVSAAPAAFGGFESASAGGGAATLDPFSPSFVAAGNGSSGGVAAGGGLTGQRHENSVLFSLSNLEALAKPAGAQLPVARSPGSSQSDRATTTEGSGLIDIRAMANMTLGAGAAKNESKGSDLPAFSAPQFSPVAPVLLAPGAGGGTPKWAIGVLVFLGVVALALTFVVVKLFTSGPAQAPVAQQPPAVAPAPVAAAPVNPAAEKAPPVTPPPASNEELPPREPAKPAAAAAEKPEKEEPRGGSKSGRGSRRGASARAGADEPAARNAAVTPTPRPVAEAPRKPKDELDMLLEAAAPGGRKTGGGSAPAARREEEEASGARAAPLSMQDVVRGMNGVMPKARDCYNQYKVPGVANVKVTVAPSGRVSNVVVTGKFAGTPSGACVESALKTAKFNASNGLTFDYVVPLR
jgi:predicted Zn finger-like uncharacterized protein